MFKSQSFDINNDESPKQSERLYQSRKAWWLKYIMQPAAVAFVLLLILCNVDFSYDPPNQNGNETTGSNETSNWNTLRTLQYPELWGNEKLIQTNCTAQLSLRLENFRFPEDLMDDVFKGEYILHSLVLHNCHLTRISDGAFNQGSLNQLLNLELTNMHLKEIQRNAFKGLVQLSNFTLINLQESLKCEGIMEAVAHTLASARITQLYVNHKVYKPEYFFGNATYRQLKKLDLSGNNVGGTVENESFRNMPRLEYLNLANCGLKTINLDLTNGAFDLLRVLDLSGNFLTLLSEQFILDSRRMGLRISLIDNKWNCSHDEMDVVKHLNPMPCPCRTSLRKVRDISSTDIPIPSQSTTSAPTTQSTKTSTKHQAPARTTKSSSTSPTTTPATSPTTTMPTTIPTTIPTTTIPTTVPTISSTDLSTLDWTTPISTTVTTQTTKGDDNSLLYDHLICVNGAKETISTTSIAYDAQMQIEDHSEGAITVVVSHLKADNWSIIYFSDMKSSKRIEQNYIVNVYDEIEVKIVNLNCATSYVFCLLIEESTTSPFNCRSHRTMSCIMNEMWFDAHSAVVVSSAIVGILLCLALGLFATYGILWLRPTWIRGSPRLIRTSQNSDKMFLMPIDYEKELYYAIGNQRTDGNLNDYANYYRHLEQTQLRRGESNKYNEPPLERAPSIPPSIEKNSISKKPNNYMYECFELYEELS